MHPLFSLMAVTIFNLMPDAMHVMDLGIAHYVLGSVFWEMTYEPRYFPDAATPSARCDALWGRIARQYHLRSSPSQSTLRSCPS